MIELKLFDVVYVNLNKGIGSEQSGIRPCVVIQNDIGNKYSPTVLIIPLTTSLKKTHQPTHCIIYPNGSNGLIKKSMLLAEALTSVSKDRIINKVGMVCETDVQKSILECYIANVTGRKQVNI